MDLVKTPIRTSLNTLTYKKALFANTCRQTLKSNQEKYSLFNGFKRQH